MANQVSDDNFENDVLNSGETVIAWYPNINGIQRRRSRRNQSRRNVESTVTRMGGECRWLDFK